MVKRIKLRLHCRPAKDTASHGCRNIVEPAKALLPACRPHPRWRPRLPSTPELPFSHVLHCMVCTSGPSRPPSVSASFPAASSWPLKRLLLFFLRTCGAQTLAPHGSCLLSRVPPLLLLQGTEREHACKHAQPPRARSPPPARERLSVISLDTAILAIHLIWKMVFHCATHCHARRVEENRLAAAAECVEKQPHRASEKSVHDNLDCSPLWLLLRAYITKAKSVTEGRCAGASSCGRRFFLALGHH